MSRNMELRSVLVEVEPGNRESLLNALRNLSDNDCDFNGENGLEYLWDEVWEANGYEDYDEFIKKYHNIEDVAELKYESNMDYLCNKVRDIKSDESCINKFIENWIGRDGYYGEYELNWLTNNDGKIIVLSLAYMCG